MQLTDKPIRNIYLGGRKAPRMPKLEPMLTFDQFRSERKLELLKPELMKMIVLIWCEL